MEQFIGCDAHKKFSVFVAVNEKGQAGEALRVAHDRQLYREFLARLPAHSAIAVEATGSYSWLVDEMERLQPVGVVDHRGQKQQVRDDPAKFRSFRRPFGVGLRPATCQP